MTNEFPRSVIEKSPVGLSVRRSLALFDFLWILYKSGGGDSDIRILAVIYDELAGFGVNAEHLVRLPLLTAAEFDLLSSEGKALGVLAHKLMRGL